MKKTLCILATMATLAWTMPAQAQELFGPGEVNLLGYGMYIDPDSRTEEWQGGAELNYFMTRNVGFGVTTHMKDFRGTFIDNLAGDVYLRFPLGQIPVAPYAVGTGGYEFDSERWFGGGGGGAELRLSKVIGIFGDIQWLFYEGGKDGIAIRMGIRLGGGR